MPIKIVNKMRTEIKYGAMRIPSVEGGGFASGVLASGQSGEVTVPPGVEKCWVYGNFVSTGGEGIPAQDGSTITFGPIVSSK